MIKEIILAATQEKNVLNYSPRDLYDVNDNNETSVFFSGVSVETVRDRDVLQRVNDPEICTLHWSFLSADATNTIFLPADFLGNTSVTSLSLSMEVFSKRPSLVIDPLALRSSQNSLTEFSVSKFDFGLQTDFNFLNGINNLEELWISKITNFTAFQYLPPLPSLQKLTVTSCPSELNEIPFPDLSPSN